LAAAIVKDLFLAQKVLRQAAYRIFPEKNIRKLKLQNYFPISFLVGW
jgi:hypothetical protein